MTDLEKNAIRENIEKIRKNVAVAAAKSGRNPGDIRIVLATKTQPPEKINYAAECGITEIGENRVQELLDKYEKLDREKLKIHFIGTLQTNKVKYIIDKVDLIHSVDSLKLGQTINKYAGLCGKVQQILIEVNVSGEESKGGISPEMLTDLLVSLSGLENIKVRGLMCIPSPEKISGENKRFFDLLYKLLVDNNNKNIDNIYMDILSMGMSGDYLTAITCGATMVRVGTKIFGQRNYTEV